MTQLAPETPFSTPSRPPPGKLPLDIPAQRAHTVAPVGHAHSAKPVRAAAPRRWTTWALALALGSVASTLGWALDDQTQAIEHASRAAETTTEVKPIEVATQQRWLATDVTVVIDASVDSITPGARQAIVQAFGAWLSSSPNLPELQLDSASGLKPRLDPDGINAVMFAPIEFAGHEEDLAITIGFSDEETGEITEADIIINSRHTYGILATETPGAPTTSCDGSSHAKVCDYQYDLQNVMTHEVGHFYGLGEDREDRTATMYSCTSACETHKRDPSAGDRQAIANLYADGLARRASLAGCQGAQVAPHTPPWSAGVLLGLPLIAWARRRRCLQTQNDE